MRLVVDEIRFLKSQIPLNRYDERKLTISLSVILASQSVAPHVFTGKTACHLYFLGGFHAWTNTRRKHKSQNNGNRALKCHFMLFSAVLEIKHAYFYDNKYSATFVVVQIITNLVQIVCICLLTSWVYAAVIHPPDPQPWWGALPSMYVNTLT